MERYPSAQQATLKARIALELGRSLAGETDLDRGLGLIVSRTNELLDSERCTIYMVDRARGELYSKRVSELEIGEIRLRLDGPGLAAHVARLGETVTLDDAYADPRFNRNIDAATGWRTRSVVAAPVFGQADGQEREVVGVLQALNRRHGGFGPEDGRLAEMLAACVGTVVEAARLHVERQGYLSSLVESLAASADALVPQSDGHSPRVAAYAAILAQALELAPDQVEVVRVAALFHETGRLGRGGGAAGSEARWQREHPRATRDFLERVRFPRALAAVPEVAGQQQERFDGRGWPGALRGGEISLGARVLAVAHTFETGSSRRSRGGSEVLVAAASRTYPHGSLPLLQAIELVRAERGRAFDPRVVDAFERALPALTAEWERLRPADQ